jgi:hypothetical protein
MWMTQPTKYFKIAQDEVVGILAVQTSLTKSDVSEHPITTSPFIPTFEIVKSRTTLDRGVIRVPINFCPFGIVVPTLNNPTPRNVIPVSATLQAVTAHRNHSIFEIKSNPRIDRIVRMPIDLRPIIREIVSIARPR